ncbi:MAG: dephospho-CoA kinase [Candidatus Omnitrophota bacterium]|nr:dephospho-CoA kinase [Candidatus Omnitrophota bacterium]
MLKVKVIGLTGSFGTGKTFVASVFRSLGAKVIDCDRIAHNIIRKGSGAYGKIIDVFGAGILDNSGNVNRKSLAKEVFGSSSKLRRLNKIVHPEVIKVIRVKLNSYKGEGVVVIDAPLLIEAGLSSLVDKIIVVKCSREKQIQRCGNKFRIEREEVSKRIKNQLSIRKKIRMADSIIDNSLSKSRTRNQVRKVWRGVWK